MSIILVAVLRKLQTSPEDDFLTPTWTNDSRRLDVIIVLALDQNITTAICLAWIGVAQSKATHVMDSFAHLYLHKLL